MVEGVEEGLVGIVGDIVAAEIVEGIVGWMMAVKIAEELVVA
jgi:hypothetical protein